MDTKEKVLYRSNAGLYILICLFLLLGFRLFVIQIISHDHYHKLAVKQQFRKVPLPARRGDILSSNGKLLARSVEVYSLYAVPRRIKDEKKIDFVHRLSRLLSLADWERERLAKRIFKKRFRYFMWVKRHLSAEAYSRIKGEIAKKNLKAVGFKREFKRYYPSGSLLCHILGFSNIDGKGLEGVEKEFNEVLEGKEGYQLVGVDALGRRLQESPQKEVPPREGQKVVLTIDSVIQHYVERELDELVARWKPKGVFSVVLDVKTGRLLALANRPHYNLNHPQKASVEDRRNRAITDYYEPGSTLKPFTALAAVREGVLTFDDTFHCHNGRHRFGPRLITDTHGYGELSVRKIVIKSSNIGMAQVGLKLGPEKVRQNVIDFGFGQKTGLEIPGEEGGKITSQRRWSFYSTTSVSMGYEIGVTALQLARAYAALVNGGYVYKTSLIEEIREEGKVVKRFKPQLLHRVYKDPRLQREILSVLRGVVEKGTAKTAQLEEYTVGGKTGTARRNARGRRGYTSKYLASFVAVAPTTDPRLVVVVMADSPKGAMYGGTVSAPAAARIVQSTLSYLGVPPDKNREEEKVAKK